VIALNERARARMLAATPRPDARLTIVPGATHLFEEPGALEAVARLAREWFDAALGPATPRAHAPCGSSRTTVRGATMRENGDEKTQRDNDDDQKRRESGEPGGGQGRRDTVGKSGVHPMSAGPDPDRDAEIRTMAGWGQGERGAAGYEDSGGSELVMRDGQLLGGLTAGPSGAPTIDIHDQGGPTGARPNAKPESREEPRPDAQREPRGDESSDESSEEGGMSRR
jgi:hypothetical protein